MALEGWAIRAVAEELNEQLIESRIDRIYQRENGDFTFHFRKRNRNFKVLISLNPETARVHLSEGNFKNLPRPLGFTQLLRNRLQGARFVKVEQPGVERLLEFQLVNLDEFGELKRFYLVAELMGRHSNLILLNQERWIVDSYKHVHSWQNRYREILPNLEYLGPPPQNKQDLENLNYASLNENSKQSLARWLRDNIDGIGRTSSEAIIKALELPLDFPVAALSEANKADLKFLLARAVEIRKRGQLFLTEGQIMPLDFSGSSTSWDQASRVLDAYYESLETKRKYQSKKHSLETIVNNALAKARRKLFALEEDLSASIDSEHLRIWGELLKNSVEPEVRSNEISVVNFYDPELKLINIPLDIRFNLQQNAQNYFRRYSKAKKGQKLIAEQLDLSKKEVDYLDTVLVAIAMAEDLEFLMEIEEELKKQNLIKKTEAKKSGSKQTRGKRKEVKTSFVAQPLQITLEGTRVSIGRNNTQNDYLIMQLAQPNDWWFHVKDSAGSHVVVHQKDLSETLFEKAAAIAAFYSKERDNSYVSVAYTQRRHLKKYKGAKPGAVHYTNFRTLYVAPRAPADFEVEE
ncbi:MAG: fibronectin/fibrinogen-binding protein [Firmicutes bacterium]|nr:fibronectin/fibrinogen-binding protein [Bacillota bacterium]